MIENIMTAVILLAMVGIVCVVAYISVMYIFPRIPITREWLEDLPDCDNKPDYMDIKR